MSRRRSLAGLSRKHPVLHLLIAAVFALGAYWGKSYWPLTIRTARDGAETNVLVERVVDGDTLVITGGDRVRLIGVDTPETKHPSKAPEPFGTEASEFTRRMVEGKRVEMRFDPGESKDRYGRSLAYVYVDGQFLNEMLIREGLARALTNYPFRPEMKQLFLAAEASAKAQRRGIWSLPAGKTAVGSRAAPRRAG